MQKSITRDDFLGMDASMKKPFITSIVFHCALFLFTAVGLPFIVPDEIISAPVSVEILPIDKISQTNRVADPVKKPEEVEDVKPQPPVEKPKPPEMKEDKPPELEPAPPEPLKKPEEKPKPPEKKPEVTKVEKRKPEKDFQTLLKNLAPDTPEPTETAEDAPKAEETPSPVSAIAQLSDKLTMSEEDALRHQLGQCWNVLAGAEYAENLIVELRIEISRERMVTNAQVTDSGRYARDTPFRAAADAAMRALRNPKCIPLAVPPDKYEQWKTTIIRFDPSEFL
ncbi:MAG: energy transducer TonB [Alphaproteobacteria bacterium]